MLITPRRNPSTCADGNELFLFILAYTELLGAYYEAVEQQGPVRAVPLSRLRQKPGGQYVLLWLLYQDHIDHWLSLPDANGQPAVLEPANRLLPEAASVFSLTQRGQVYAENFLDCVLGSMLANSFTPAGCGVILGDLTPCYQSEDRRFSWGRHLLKEFRQPSGNQELVLCSAEEMDWPVWFDDPLPRLCGANPKVRLHDTIKNLNRKQKRYLVHFKGDGTGRRIGWELR